MRHLLNSTAIFKQFSSKQRHRRSFPHPISSAISKCRNLEGATLFLFVLIAINLQMRHLVNENCATVNNSTCIATLASSDKLVKSLTSENTRLKDALEHKSSMVDILESINTDLREINRMLKEQVGEAKKKQLEIFNPYLRITYKKGIAV